jgi:hypothetical protein
MKADTIKIDLSPAPGIFRVALRHAILWSYLVGAEFASHYLFGGSWVIDLMILVIMCAFVTVGIRKEVGLSVKMTKPEIKLWVASGMPGDIKEWHDARAESGRTDAAEPAAGA